MFDLLKTLQSQIAEFGFDGAILHGALVHKAKCGVSLHSMPPPTVGLEARCRDQQEACRNETGSHSE